MERRLLSGNEAIARGIYESGGQVAVGYPGTPSTKILETVAREYPVVTAQWLAVLLERVPAKSVELNREAFLKGAALRVGDGG